MLRARLVIYVLTFGLLAGLLVQPTVAALTSNHSDTATKHTTAFGQYGQGLGVIFKQPPKVVAAKPLPAKQLPLAGLAEPLSLPTPTAALILPPIFHDATIPPVKNGLAPVIINIPTTQKVVFLGIDDGAYKEQSEIDLLAQQKVRASLFLADLFVGDKSAFFKGFIPHGSLVENHTLNHRQMSLLSYNEQVHEICGEADLQEQQFGRRPVLFRPPFGDYNQNTQRAAATCGMKAVVLWVAKANGGSIQYQIGNSLRPGDIVLMHFRPEFAQDLKAFIEAQNAAGLHTELLEDWLSPS